ncbi:MAG: DEAD/DEAH box helicase [Acidimicrobiales bacterium]
MSTPHPAPERAPAPDGERRSFADLDVPDRIVAALAARGITTPFPIQVATLPDALGGRDVCGRAPTGSGKTIAFGIPLVLAAASARPGRPRGLVLVPTRELAAQVATELELLAGRRGPRVQTFYGGVGFGPQLRALHHGVDIAVACPGRLADLIGQGAIDLGDVEVVVIDEADRMADMGFLPEVRRLLDRCPEDRQTLLFSATLDGDVDVLATRYQRDPVRHEPPHTEGHDGADHRWWRVERAERIATTAALVDRVGPTIVFCRTRHGADRVARQLTAAGVSAAAIHGGRSQAQRDRALRAFHRGEVAALAATDVAARGSTSTG